MLPDADPEYVMSYAAARRDRATHLRPKPNVKNFRSSLRRPLASSHLEGLKASGSGYTSGSLAIALWRGQETTTASGFVYVQMVPNDFSASGDDVVFLLKDCVICSSSSIL